MAEFSKDAVETTTSKTVITAVFSVKEAKAVRAALSSMPYGVLRDIAEQLGVALATVPDEE